MITLFTLETGNVLELYEPPRSGLEPMLRGTCPGCGCSTHGYVGRCAAIREVDSEGRPTTGEYTTSYGHLPCVERHFTDLVALLDVPDFVPEQLTWHRGTQRDVTTFVELHINDVVEVRKVSGRGRHQRYDFRLRSTK